MNQSLLNKCMLPIVTACLLISTSFAQEDQSTPKAPSGVEDCSHELLISYFPKVFVQETLKKFNVPQDKWDAIINELGEKDKLVIKTVEEKAASLDPNPLKDPKLRQDAVKLFRETLTNIFSSTLKAQGITDEKQIQDMLDDIQQQKAKRFASCMSKLSHSSPSTSGLSGSYDEEKDDEDEELK